MFDIQVMEHAVKLKDHNPAAAGQKWGHVHLSLGHFFGRGNDGENMGNSMKLWFLLFNITLW
jgi:hypothetical protein